VAGGGTGDDVELLYGVPHHHTGETKPKIFKMFFIGKAIIL
jgi:hypothetical protein